jgi:hypothetical protein
VFTPVFCSSGPSIQQEWKQKQQNRKSFIHFFQVFEVASRTRRQSDQDKRMLKALRVPLPKLAGEGLKR